MLSIRMRLSKQLSTQAITSVLSFYSNENFPIDAVVLLRNLGYDVLTSYEAGQANQGISDSEVLTYATGQSRVVITQNRKDFIQLHHEGFPHAGIVVWKDDRDCAGQVEMLHHYLRPTGQTTDSLCNRLIRIKKRNQPKSEKQTFVIQEYGKE